MISSFSFHKTNKKFLFSGPTFLSECEFRESTYGKQPNQNCNSVTRKYPDNLQSTVRPLVFKKCQIPKIYEKWTQPEQNHINSVTRKKEGQKHQAQW